MPREFLRVAVEAARAGGNAALEGFGKATEAKAKDISDIVTRWDIEAERRVIETIKARFPDHEIMAEESGVQGENEFVWIIDPLDGTKNFYRGLGVFATSVALAWGARLVLGVIYDPVNDELYWAQEGEGAWLNNSRIWVSEHPSLQGAFLATGFPHRGKEALEPYLETFREFFKRALSIRRLGAAALDLALVARGIFDGFWEFTLYPWDVAAGYVLVKEAGGVMTDFEGLEDFITGPASVLAGNPKVHREMLEILRKISRK